MGLPELTKNAVHVLPEGGLEAKLALGRPLRVKLGIDVTTPDVTLGHGVPLQRMAAFQREGHIGVLIVGDYTTRIGDPSGRSVRRPVLSGEEIDRNAQRYFEQASAIIDPERTEFRFNSEWLGKLDYAEIVRLTRTATVARLLERDDFAKRFAEQTPISVSELLYPIMQGYDSVAVEADVELGGTDQLYNLLMGREVQEAYGQEPQVALTVELLVSWDEELMSQSKGNYIGLAEAPEEQFGKAMRIPDALLGQWYRLVMDEDDVPGRRSSRGEARACAVHRHALPRRGGRPGGRSALHARRARGACARGRPRGSVARGRSRAPAVLARRRPRNRHHERGPPAARAGGGQGERRGRDGARSAARTACGSAAPGGQAPVRAVSSGVARSFATMPRPPRKRLQEACNRHRRPVEREDTTYVSPSTRGLRCEPEAFFGPQRGCGL